MNPQSIPSSRISPGCRAALLAAAAVLVTSGTTKATDFIWGGGDLPWTDTSALGWNGGPPAIWAGDTATINIGTVTTTAGDQEAGLAITLGGTGVLNTAGGYFDQFTSLSFVDGGTLTAVGGNAVWGAGALGSFSVSGSSPTGALINGSYFNVWDGSTFTVADVTGNTDADLTISALLNKIEFQSSAAITKSGSGTLSLAANNLLNGIGSVTITGGTLSQTTGAGWSQLNNLTLQGGTLESVTTSLSTFGCYWIPGTVTVSGFSASAFTTVGSGEQFLNLGDLGSTTGATTFHVGDVTSSPAADLVVSTKLGNEPMGGAAGLIKSGDGTMTLNADNTHTGGTTVNAGVLEVAGSNVGNGYLRGAATVNSGAELRYTGGDGTGFGFNGGNKLDTLNIDGGLVDSQNTTHLWSATLNMTGGELRVNGGVSNPDAGPAIQWNNVTANTLASANAAAISGRLNLRGDNGYTSAVFDVADGSAATDLLVSAAVTELDGSVGITKNGDGAMVLSGTNTFTGNTVVNAGSLELATGAQMKFVIADATSTRVEGSGTVEFKGAFSIDTSAVTVGPGATWQLVDLAGLNETFQPTFSVAGFDAQPDGHTWTKPAGAAKFSFDKNTGVLSLVAASTDYDTWIGANGVTGGKNDDDDKDGITNFEEYAFGLSPANGASCNPITVPLDKAGGTFTYTRRTRSLTGLQYTVRTSTDLEFWAPATVIEDVSGPVADVETVQVTLDPAPTAPTFFIQVRAN